MELFSIIFAKHQVSSKILFFFITVKGLMIINPWDYPFGTRVFYDTYTGITKEMWESLLNQSYPESYQFTFNLIDKNNYICMKSFIAVHEKKNNYVVMGCTLKNLNYQNKVLDRYLIFLWSMVGISIIMLMSFYVIYSILFIYLREIQIMNERFQNWLEYSLKHDDFNGIEKFDCKSTMFFYRAYYYASRFIIEIKYIKQNIRNLTGCLRGHMMFTCSTLGRKNVTAIIFAKVHI